MKVFLKVLVVTLFASITGLTGSASPPPSHQNKLAQVKNVSPQDSSISVFLPQGANVTLKKGNSMSGKLTEIDPQAEEIKLELSGESTTVEIAEIEKVEFSGDVILGCGNSDCKIVIRGDEDETSSGNNQKTWSEPLTNFRVINPSTGEAQIKLTSLPKLQLRGILSVASSSFYVVKEIQFDNDLGKIMLKVTPR
ncbi:MAG: hypothetical protein AB4368_07355 [Xenococcaceae cyanobacterium]